MKTDHPVFVFGSNRAGRHGAGAASFARRYRGAVMGQGEGRQGNSYAIPTKDRGLRPLPLYEIERNVRTFLNYAAEHADEGFQVTAIGCGLAGYAAHQIGPMFADAPGNCYLCAEFANYHRDHKGAAEPPTLGQQIASAIKLEIFK
jgi:hypothetical protein